MTTRTLSVVTSKSLSASKIIYVTRIVDEDWSSFQLAIIRHRMNLTCTDIAPSAKIPMWAVLSWVEADIDVIFRRECGFPPVEILVRESKS